MSGSRFEDALEHSFKRMEESAVFINWKKENREAYLAHAFNMVEGKKQSGWQFGYYIKSKDRVVTFFVEDVVKKSPESEIFKKDEKAVKKLELSKVKVGADRALELASGLQKEKYKGHEPQKEVVLLQTIDAGQVWNITFVTRTFDTLNIKICAESGEVKSDNLTSLFSFGTKNV